MQNSNVKTTPNQNPANSGKNKNKNKKRQGGAMIDDFNRLQGGKSSPPIKKTKQDEDLTSESEEETIKTKQDSNPKTLTQMISVSSVAVDPSTLRIGRSNINPKTIHKLCEYLRGEATANRAVDPKSFFETDFLLPVTLQLQAEGLLSDEKDELEWLKWDIDTLTKNLETIYPRQSVGPNLVAALKAIPFQSDFKGASKISEYSAHVLETTGKFSEIPPETERQCVKVLIEGVTAGEFKENKGRIVFSSLLKQEDPKTILEFLKTAIKLNKKLVDHVRLHEYYALTPEEVATGQWTANKKPASKPYGGEHPKSKGTKGANSTTKATTCNGCGKTGHTWAVCEFVKQHHPDANRDKNTPFTQSAPYVAATKGGKKPNRNFLRTDYRLDGSQLTKKITLPTKPSRAG